MNRNTYVELFSYKQPFTSDAVGQGKISSTCLFVWTTTVVLIVQDLVCTGTAQSVHTLVEVMVDAGRHVELWIEVGSWGGQ